MMETAAESMPVSDAEALLFALGDSLTWQYEETKKRIARWSARTDCYKFEVHGDLTGRKVYRGENGALLGWWLKIESVAPRQTLTDRIGWCFPCLTAEGAKLLCQQFAWTGDATEVARLESCRYPLEWSGCGFGPPHPPDADTATLRRNAGSVAGYFVEPRLQWSIRHFRARYDVELHRDFRAKDLAVFLSTFHLRPPSVSPHHYGSAEEARAACALHHATGKWCRGTLPKHLGNK